MENMSAIGPCHSKFCKCLSKTGFHSRFSEPILPQFCGITHMMLSSRSTWKTRHCSLNRG